MSHGSEFLILCRFISRTLKRVKEQQNMRNKENNGHIEQGKSVMTSSWLTRKIHAKNSFYSFAVVVFVKKCPNTEFFLVRIQENTDQKKLRIWTLFTQCTVNIRLFPTYQIGDILYVSYNTIYEKRRKSETLVISVFKKFLTKNALILISPLI